MATTIGGISVDMGSVYGQQLAPKEVEPPAQDHEILENLFKRAASGSATAR